MAANQYKGFCVGGGVGSPNSLSTTAWAALTTLLQNGFQPGIAISEQVNTALRQTSVPAAGVAQFIANNQASDVLDDASASNFAALLLAAVQGVITAYNFWMPGDIKGTLIATVPTGWLKCNGAVKNRADFPALFAAIGTTYNLGTETGSQFRIPEMRGEFIRGWDDGRGADGGRALGSFQDWMIVQHQHAGVPLLQGDTDRGTQSSNYSVDNNGNTGDIAGVSGARIGAEVRPRNIATQWLIKT